MHVSLRKKWLAISNGTISWGFNILSTISGDQTENNAEFSAVKTACIL